ncbi:MAG: ABC transporter permease, partial [Alphaproteobacteria bacterium]|nr:ABC transporter permease [Alphaproteobacteria bacterium]
MSEVRASLTRLWAMIVKELWAVLRDPKGRITLIVPPVIQLVLFASAATLEVKNVAIGVYSRDNGPATIEFVQQMAGS